MYFLLAVLQVRFESYASGATGLYPCDKFIRNTILFTPNAIAIISYINISFNANIINSLLNYIRYDKCNRIQILIIRLIPL